MRMIYPCIFLSILLIHSAGCEFEKEKFKYMHTARVTYIPQIEWDEESAPDVQVKLRRTISDDWEFVTNIDEDNNFEYVDLVFQPEVRASYENWEVQIVDHDEEDADDVMFSRIFNPGELGLDGIIEFKEDQIEVLKIFYDER